MTNLHLIYQILDYFTRDPADINMYTLDLLTQNVTNFGKFRLFKVLLTENSNDTYHTGNFLSDFTRGRK